MTEFWQQCIERLSQGMTVPQVKQWIMPLVPIGFNEDETEFHLSAPSPLKQNWAKQYYAPIIQELIKEYFQHDVKVVVLIQGKASSPEKTPVEIKPKVDVLPQTLAPEETIEEGIRVVVEHDDAVLSKKTSFKAPEINVIENSSTGSLDVPDVYREIYNASNLNPHLTFENLVVGPSNELAEATAQTVLRNLGKVGYNPFFLYGSTGLGKTHLMQAIGNALFKQGGAKRVKYIHANDYYTALAAKMRSGDWVEYRTEDVKEYSNLDLLLIDDIQFFTKKDRTQQEFFYLYETMVNKGKQVVISSDTYPRELEEMDERLISRFNSGIVIQIEPPELEMRVAILNKKAENHPHITLNSEAAFFIAKNIRSNVRELEGGLQKVIAYAQFRRQQEITVDICREALKDLLRVANGMITVDNIQKTVADFYKMRVADIYSKSRRSEVVRVRHIAMYLAKELTRKSLPELGKAFGGRDHSTVHHAVEKIIELRAVDRELNHDLHVLEQTLKG